MRHSKASECSLCFIVAVASSLPPRWFIHPRRKQRGIRTVFVNQAFGYWFDFGDDWWHQINVVAIEEKVKRGKYPKVVKRTGKSPPQYIDWDEEGE